MITVTHKRNHDYLIVDFEAYNDLNLESIEVTTYMSQKIIHSKLR
jgi:uncharacterized protein YkvS